jgi:hypothetical protein
LIQPPTFGVLKASRRIASLLFAGLALAIPAVTHAQGPDTAREIMRRVFRDSRADNEVVSVTMSLVEAGGRTRTRAATFYSKKKTAEDSVRLIRFHSPAEFSRSGILTLERSDGDADQWVYLPAYHASRRVPTANRGDLWMGTDFTYEDINDVKIERYDYRMTGMDRIDGTACTLIEATPREKKLMAETAYGKTVSCVDVDQSVALRTVYFDKAGREIKTLVNSVLRRYGRYRRWDRSVMTDVKRNHMTVLDVTDRKVDAGLSDDYFDVRYLERGR